jgi:hypothetical protein
MELLNFLRDYPAIGGVAIGAIFGAIFGVLGWIGKTAYELYVDKTRYKRELKTLFWKEKISAAKKASEYYLEYLNFLNLARIQYENFEKNEIEYATLIEDFQSQMVFYQDKLKTFPHFKHHHINIFYDFDQDNSMKITNEIIAYLREIMELNSEIENKAKTKELFGGLKRNYETLFNIHKEYIKKVREDLQNNV